MLLIFGVSAFAEWMVFSRLKPVVFGWNKLDKQSFVWSALAGVVLLPSRPFVVMLD